VCESETDKVPRKLETRPLRFCVAEKATGLVQASPKVLCESSLLPILASGDLIRIIEPRRVAHRFIDIPIAYNAASTFCSIVATDQPGSSGQDGEMAFQGTFARASRALV
jgi:hypothetical protein